MYSWYVLYIIQGGVAQQARDKGYLTKEQSDMVVVAGSSAAFLISVLRKGRAGGVSAGVHSFHNGRDVEGSSPL